LLQVVGYCLPAPDLKYRADEYFIPQNGSFKKTVFFFFDRKIAGKVFNY
jgi:hypothetical protein